MALLRSLVLNLWITHSGILDTEPSSTYRLLLALASLPYCPPGHKAENGLHNWDENLRLVSSSKLLPSNYCSYRRNDSSVSSLLFLVFCKHSPVQSEHVTGEATLEFFFRDLKEWEWACHFSFLQIILKRLIQTDVASRSISTNRLNHVRPDV